MENFYYIDMLLWFSIPNISLFFLNLFCMFKKRYCPPIYYIFSIGLSFLGFLFGPSCMCREIGKKAMGSIFFISLISGIFIFIISYRLFFLNNQNSSKCR